MIFSLGRREEIKSISKMFANCGVIEKFSSPEYSNFMRKIKEGEVRKAAIEYSLVNPDAGVVERKVAVDIARELAKEF
ncbi:hypothetical protein [Streptococcus hyovaginalis]|uniref:hypothetical protein n=1 Tax=Streptococcus hyovaginalis TaxID=149015 RepID=UPI003B3B5A0B